MNYAVCVKRELIFILYYCNHNSLDDLRYDRKPVLTNENYILVNFKMLNVFCCNGHNDNAHCRVQSKHPKKHFKLSFFIRQIETDCSNQL